MALRMEPSPARMTTHREGVTVSGQSAMAAAGQILLSAHSHRLAPEGISEPAAWHPLSRWLSRVIRSDPDESYSSAFATDRAAARSRIHRLRLVVAVPRTQYQRLPVPQRHRCAVPDLVTGRLLAR